ncbi:NosD domain-containing protein [Halovenus carboxidivorans]|nr:NosD domain-containing protein [Halovenus carboxidivorans]
MFGSAIDRAIPLRLVGIVGFVLVTLSVGVFVIGAEGTAPEPVPFDETVETGMAAENEQTLRAADATLPKAEVFHSQYQFVVGYRGVGYMIDELQQSGHTQQFGQPVAIYVSDYAGTDPTLTEERYPQTETEVDWVRARDATFVVDSAARTPAGDAIIPFSSTGDAAQFAEQHGGDLLDWEELRSKNIDLDHAGLVREGVETKQASANDSVAAAEPLINRSTSVIVGEGAPTIQAAIDATTPGTTIRVPPGTYTETLQVNRPVTIRGHNATIRGDGNGSVITIASDDVTLSGLSIEGVGQSTEPEEGEVNTQQWDSFVESGYGHSDAAIEAENVSNLFVHEVSITTPTSGIVLRDVNGTVVDGISVVGSEDHRDGFMGVLSIRSPVVVQHSTFEDGRDGVYLHRADGSVVRDNRFVSNRYGIHLMYTSDALLADNVARREAFAGITIMTEPASNAVVGNDVRNSTSGLDISGTHTYVGENIIANNDRAILGGTDQSLYERNVLYGNELGFRTGTIRPSNRVVRNDFVDNEQSVQVGSGPLRIWTHDSNGNYWSKRPTAFSDGLYSPTARLDSNLREPGVGALSRSPAATILETVRETVAGSRESQVVDTAPRSEPVRPQTITALEETHDD